MKLIFLVTAFLMVSAYGQGGMTVVSVGEAGNASERLVFSPVYNKGGLTINHRKMANQVVKLFLSDFSFYKKSFDVAGVEGSTSGSSYSSPRYSEWAKKNVKYLVNTQAESLGNSLKISVALFDISKRTKLLDINKAIGRYDLRKVGHGLADRIYRKITRKESIFNSKIVFVSDRTGPRNASYKELYIMDFDGENKKQLTRHRATVISPAFSQDKKRVMYSLIRFHKGRKNVNLRMLNIETGKDEIISKRKGINSGAVFMPGEKEILLTLSYEGNAEIYRMNLRTRRLKKVTKHYSDDVDPSIAVDGKLMTFLSGRPGKPMIYTADPRSREKSVKRISYVGKFNATPRFSPDGSEIVFASWVDERFDLFRINSRGTGLVRLTKDFGSNEDPSYSNDGEFIAFNSLRVITRRKASQHIYIMDRNGEILRDITPNYGNCLSPRWSK